MKNIFPIFLFCAGAITVWAQQDYTVSINPRKGLSYSYDQYPFPEGIKVYDMDKNTHYLHHYLQIDGLTLIQVWSTCCGAEPEVWSRARELEESYRDRGLKTISVNFENGTDFAEQHRLLGEFFKKIDQPEHFFFDGLGYVIDFLKVPGFPTYFLVSAENQVVFRTSGKDEEGVSLLEGEIQARLR